MARKIHRRVRTLRSASSQSATLVVEKWSLTECGSHIESNNQFYQSVALRFYGSMRIFRPWIPFPGVPAPVPVYNGPGRADIVFRRRDVANNQHDHPQIDTSQALPIIGGVFYWDQYPMIREMMTYVSQDMGNRKLTATYSDDGAQQSLVVDTGGTPLPLV